MNLYLVEAYFGNYDDFWKNTLGIFSEEDMANTVKADFEKKMKNQKTLPFPKELSDKGITYENISNDNSKEEWNILHKWSDAVQDAKDFNSVIISDFILDKVYK
jgi:predicted GH43/DUF377 family glycosyl hydrolase